MILLESPPSSLDYSLILGFLGGVLSVAATLLGGLNWLNNRFTSLERAIAQNQSDLRLLDQRWESTEDKITLVANGNREAVQHARDRFFDELKRLDRELSNDLNDVANYLAKKGDFVIRTRSGTNDD